MNFTKHFIAFIFGLLTATTSLHSEDKTHEELTAQAIQILNPNNRNLSKDRVINACGLLAQADSMGNTDAKSVATQLSRNIIRLVLGNKDNTDFSKECFRKLGQLAGPTIYEKIIDDKLNEEFLAILFANIEGEASEEHTHLVNKLLTHENNFIKYCGLVAARGCRAHKDILHNNMLQLLLNDQKYKLYNSTEMASLLQETVTTISKIKLFDDDIIKGLIALIDEQKDSLATHYAIICLGKIQNLKQEYITYLLKLKSERVDTEYEDDICIALYRLTGAKNHIYPYFKKSFDTKDDKRTWSTLSSIRFLNEEIAFDFKEQILESMHLSDANFLNEETLRLFETYPSVFMDRTDNIKDWIKSSKNNVIMAIGPIVIDKLKSAKEKAQEAH